MKKELINFYSNKKVLVTGHSGFKGSWLCKILNLLGSEVFGISLPPENDSLFFKIGIDKFVSSFFFDISDFELMDKTINKIKPDIIIHMAAQPLVIESYLNPLKTYQTNIMGTVNICEIIRNMNSKLSFINVTTDKVYENIESMNKYCEDDTLNGRDPYSNSKSCSDIITQSYIKCFFNENISASICRSGNVIGGGDYCKNRIVPDIFRSIINGKVISVRSPNSIRPYQHVLEANIMYLIIAMEQYNNKEKSSSYNISPDDESITTTLELVNKFKEINKNINITIEANDYTFHESNLLLISNKKIKKIFNWIPFLNINESVALTNEWYMSDINNLDMVNITNSQINFYLDRIGKYKW